MRLDRWEDAARAGRIARAWWTDLRPDPERGRPGDRAALARLRRAATPLDAAEIEQAVGLARALGAGRAEFEEVAVCAAVLAHVREDMPGTPVARAIAAAADGSRPVVSPLRFRRLVEARDAAERLTGFRRLVALAGHRLDVADLAVAVLDWSDRRRRDWIFLYHGGEPPRAETEPTPAELTPAETGDAAR